MTGFATFDEFLALDRVVALTMSHDGRRLVATVASLRQVEDVDKLVTSLWEVDPEGAVPAARLTRSDAGESGAVFHRDGSVLFLAARDDSDDPPALWSLPPAGEARAVAGRPGGITGIATARGGDAVVLASPTLPGSVDGDTDESRRDARKNRGTRAMLHRESPVRFWDHDLGPDEQRLLALASPPTDAEPVEPADLTPTPGRALDEATFTMTPDGGTVITSWNRPHPGVPVPDLVAIDVATGTHRVLAAGLDRTGYSEPAVSPDGRRVIAVRSSEGTREQLATVSLWLADLATGEGRELLADPDVWPASPTFSAAGDAVFFLADEHGHRPVFRLDLDTEAVTRVTASGHYAELNVAPDGRTLYALRDAVDSPPRPVRLDATATDGDVVELPAPGATTATAPVEQVTVTVADGTEVHARLVLPAGASADRPAPLVLWVHGGPLGSWNGWSWRWNPWLLAGRGYAVLLPDPALSTGYGARMIERGWAEWGGAPYDDLMAITDEALRRPDLDASRTAAMGGSYGGYMANWIAGHTDRFRCIVTHASLWALDQFQGTTDVPGSEIEIWGLPAQRPEFYEKWSPHHFVDAITTPMLVIHGDRDYRVPIGEALRLWWDLQRTGVESSYLYFPDEGHWVLKPGNARVWYETVWAWLAQHVLEEPWTQPELL